VGRPYRGSSGRTRRRTQTRYRPPDPRRLFRLDEADLDMLQTKIAVVASEGGRPTRDAPIRRRGRRTKTANGVDSARPERGRRGSHPPARARSGTAGAGKGRRRVGLALFVFLLGTRVNGTGVMRRAVCRRGTRRENNGTTETATRAYAVRAESALARAGPGGSGRGGDHREEQRLTRCAGVWLTPRSQIGRP